MSNIHDVEVRTIDGERQTLAGYEGKHLLIVNVASKAHYRVKAVDWDTVKKPTRSRCQDRPPWEIVVT